MIGNESDIKAWTLDDLKRYFNVYYSANNAVAVIVGDVKVDQVKRLVTKYFGTIAKRALPPPVRTVEPPQKGEGNYAVFFGDDKKMFNAPEHYRKLTMADIQRVAAKYLVKSQRTVGVLAAKEDGLEKPVCHYRAVRYGKRGRGRISPARI